MFVIDEHFGTQAKRYSVFPNNKEFPPDEYNINIRVIIKSSSAWLIRRSKSLTEIAFGTFSTGPILSHRLITRRPDKPDWELSTSTRPARYNFYGESSRARGRRDRFNVVDGKTSVLDSTDSSSAAIAISGLPLARLPSAKRARTTGEIYRVSAAERHKRHRTPPPRRGRQTKKILK